MIGIISVLPSSFMNEVTTTGNAIIIIIELAGLALVIASCVLLTQGTRKIPVQYAKRVVGRRVYGGTTQYLPIRVNAAGVIDRKSTRLNSSHVAISYAVFCLKKKNTIQ